jgi:hypothetical protein
VRSQRLPIDSFNEMLTHDGGDGELVLLSIVEQLQDIITNNDTALAGKNVLDTHDFASSRLKKVCRFLWKPRDQLRVEGREFFKTDMLLEDNRIPLRLSVWARGGGIFFLHLQGCIFI